MSDEKPTLTGKLYLIRHGEYNKNGFPRLTEGGKKRILERAETIKEDMTYRRINPIDSVLFSSGYPRTLDSLLEIGNHLNLYSSSTQIRVTTSLWGGSKEDFSEFLKNLSNAHQKSYIAVGHLDMLDDFPGWFIKGHHPKIDLKSFYENFKNIYAAGVFIDFQTGEVRDLSRPREQQVIVLKPEVPKVAIQPKPVIIAPKPTIPSVPVLPKPEPKPYVPYVARQYPPMAPKGEEGQIPDDCDLPF